MNSDQYFNTNAWLEFGKNPKAIVVIDFDGTITDQDAVDGLIARFSSSDEWKLSEEKWQSGEIGSAECMTQQLQGVRANRQELDLFLSEIKVDKAFTSLQNFLKNKNIPLLIMSDGFDLLIRGIFNRHSLSGIPVLCNHLEWNDNRFIPSFPYIEHSCGQCAHCKKKSIQSIKLKYPQVKIVYIGDGRSDICAISEADFIYAKNSLAVYCDQNKLIYQKYRSLSDVLSLFPKTLKSLTTRESEELSAKSDELKQ